MAPINRALTSDNCQFTTALLNRSFKHRALKRLYERGDGSRIRSDLLPKVERILTVLDSAATPQARNNESNIKVRRQYVEEVHA